MQDSILTSLVTVPVAIMVLLIFAMFMLEYTDTQPRSPIGSIPKVIMDYVDNATVVTVVSVADYRYDAIIINYTIGNKTFSKSALGRYALDVSLTESLFNINVTAIWGSDYYMLNCTVEVEHTSGSSVYLWIREEGHSSSSKHRVPFTLLAEWRDVT